MSAGKTTATVIAVSVAVCSLMAWAGWQLLDYKSASEWGRYEYITASTELTGTVDSVVTNRGVTYIKVDGSDYLIQVGYFPKSTYVKALGDIDDLVGSRITTTEGSDTLYVYRPTSGSTYFVFRDPAL